MQGGGHPEGQGEEVPLTAGRELGEGGVLVLEAKMTELKVLDGKWD